MKKKKSLESLVELTLRLLVEDRLPAKSGIARFPNETSTGSYSEQEARKCTFISNWVYKKPN
jgi:hypothetical protein